MNFDKLRIAALALGISVDTLPPEDFQVSEPVTAPCENLETDLTDEELVLIESVLPAVCGGSQRDAISSLLWLVSTGRPWTMLPERFGSWDSQRHRFARWAHKGVWVKIASVIDGVDLPEARKRLFKSVALKAERQKEMLPQHRKRVCGY